jgi:hypothetical protein
MWKMWFVTLGLVSGLAQAETVQDTLPPELRSARAISFTVSEISGDYEVTIARPSTWSEWRVEDKRDERYSIVIPTSRSYLPNQRKIGLTRADSIRKFGRTRPRIRPRHHSVKYISTP